MRVRPSETFTSAGCGERRRARREPGVAVLRDLLVHRVAEHQAQLGLHRPVDGLGAGERLGRLGAPPRELLAALTPAVAAELGEHRRDRAVVLLVAVEGAQRQLPAHRGLGLAKCLPVFIACRCSAQPGPASKSGRLRNTHASLCRRVRHSSLPALGPHALLQADRLELPLVVAELLGQLLDLLLDLLLRLVRAVRAAALRPARARAR